jgi:methionine sulfoxide reductase heme-binding subunit
MGAAPPARWAGWRAHLLALLLGAAGWWLGWAVRGSWDPEMRLWKAFGDAAFVLLVAVVLVGPAARLWRPVRGLLPARRALGIWFALAALVHAVLILNGWVRWELLRFLGYEFVPQLGRMARLEPGFGLANLLGTVALLWALTLAATSSDRAVRALGSRAWKWLHSFTYVIFYLAALHVVYFLFIHYTASFHRMPPPPDPLRWPTLAVILVVVVLQLVAFVVTVRRRSAPSPARS